MGSLPNHMHHFKKLEIGTYSVIFPALKLNVDVC